RDRRIASQDRIAEPLDAVGERGDRIPILPPLRPVPEPAGSLPPRDVRHQVPVLPVLQEEGQLLDLGRGQVVAAEVPHGEDRYLTQDAPAVVALLPLLGGLSTLRDG